MKILPKMLALSLVLHFVTIKPAKPAIPLLIAPAVCAKVCVLIGTAVVGGVTSYVWQHTRTKKKYFADKKGNVRKMLADPDEEISIWEDYVQAANAQEAFRKCRNKASNSNGRLASRPRYDYVRKYWVCRIEGGNS